MSPQDRSLSFDEVQEQAEREKLLLPRVEAGIRYLNENHEGWAGRIDLNKLNLHDCEDCVIGQLFGDYSGGKYDHLQMDSFEMLRHGFTLPWGAYWVSWDTLTKLWKTKIEELRLDSPKT